MDADMARSILRRIMDFSPHNPDDHLSVIQDLVRYEPFASVADDVCARLYSRALQIFYDHTACEDVVIGEDDVDALFYLIQNRTETEDDDHQVGLIFETLLHQRNGIALLERVAELVMTKGTRDNRQWIQTLVHDTLSEPNRSCRNERTFPIREFLRFFPLIANFPGEPFDLCHVELWLGHWIQGPVSRADLDALLDVAPVDVFSVENVMNDTPRMLLEAYRDRWSKTEDPRITRLVFKKKPPKDAVTRVCESLQRIDGLDADHPLWEIIATHTPVYTRISLRNKTYMRSIREARHRWRWARFRVAVRAVSAGALMWRLYQTWSLHPARLALAASGLSAATTQTRQAMGNSNATDVAEPSIGAEFRLLDVAAYVLGV